MTSEPTDVQTLQAFASAVRERCAKSDARYRFGRSKVFLACLGLDRHVSRLLVEAHRAGLLRLSRCDLVQAVEDRSVIADSEVAYLNATFHLVEI